MSGLIMAAQLLLGLSILVILHGVLFMMYVVLLIMAWMEYKWSFKKSALIGVASLLPFAPFWVDKKLKEDNSNKSW